VVDWNKEAIQALREAVYTRDGASVVAVLRGRLIDEALQLAGDGLLDAIAQGVAGAAELAAQCAAALREREWWGDEELADQLEAAVGKRATPMLRPLSVDLEELASFLEGDPIHGSARIDLKTGEIWPYDSLFGDISEEEDDEERWLYVDNQGSRDGYRDMERFIGMVEDPDIADSLEIAITGNGAFRRFKDVLSRWPDELERYYQLSSERQRGRARMWLACEGYRPTGARQ